MSDKKIPHTTNGTTIDYYNADVIIANDYAPFGALLPGRKYTQANTKYRYGFNGKENDNEVKGEGNAYDFGARNYDPRLGKFLSIDLKFQKYPSFSPYSYGMGNPIYCIDIDGNDIIGLTDLVYKKNWGNAINALGIVDKNAVFKKLTANFAVGGMYDKNKIDLVFSNFNDNSHPATGLAHQEGKYQTTSSSGTSIVGGTAIFATVKGVTNPISFDKLTEEQSKNVVRWQVAVQIDSRLFAEGAVGVVSHEVSHALLQGKLLNDFRSEKTDFKTAQAEYNKMIKDDKDPNSNKTTPAHTEIANNTGGFRELNVSILNAVASVTNGAGNPGLTPSRGVNGNLSPYDLLVGFLNGMIQSYSGNHDAGNSNLYKGTSRNDNNQKGAQVAPKQ